MNSQWDIAAVAVAGLGLALVCARLFVSAFLRDLNHKVFGQAISKLLAAGNRDRAIKLTRAAPRAYVAIVTRALLEESTALAAADGESLVRESLMERGRLAIAAEQRDMRRTGWLSIAGALLAAIGAFIGFSGEGSPSDVLTGVVVLAVLGAVAGWHKANKQVISMKASMARHAEELTAYVMKG